MAHEQLDTVEHRGVEHGAVEHSRVEHRVIERNTDESNTVEQAVQVVGRGTGEHYADEGAFELPDTLLDAILSKSPSQGLTHTFYRYPARFSPKFVRAAIQELSAPGAVVLDPFMGSGTTLVEALVLGRHAIGSDISPLARFITRAKTTVLTVEECNQLDEWLVDIQPSLNLHLPARRDTDWAERGYQKDIPWPIRKTLEFVLYEVDALPSPAQRNLARCALLSASQWALDCTTGFPSAREFRAKFASILRDFYVGIAELRSSIARHQERAPSVVCLDVPAAQLQASLWEAQVQDRPSLVVTSPPYPQVHVLYHRWQIMGRRETPAPFWIAGELDGNGGSYYTMGGRSVTGVNNYFQSIEESFTRIHSLLADGALVVQLIAFTHVESQLPRYLQAMEHAGFQEVSLGTTANGTGRVWRQVPLRRWYATYKGQTQSSLELFLIHKRR
ncbi:MAG: site-specific DNA-methyltransferase [Chloroflexota bacterium]|nr:site-specific DNA-methyltransferase [Chloroflexota bacterium]MDQ5864457.1 site-specific DNA-methyltransferase [Chloroflexota bacterium]